MKNRLKDKRFILGLERAITSVYPEFKKENRRAKLALIKAISIASPVETELFDTEKYASYIILYKTLRKHGTSPQTVNKMLEKYPLFVWEGNLWDSEKGEAKRYQPSKELIDIVDHFADDKYSDLYVSYNDHSGNHLILLDTLPTNLKEEDVIYSCTAEIDTEALSMYTKKIMRSKEKYCKIVNLQMTLAVAKKMNGKLEQRYSKCRSGRLISRGVESVQNMGKEARAYAFNGCYDIDFQSAHYRILNHLVEDDFIAFYAENSDMVRNRISEDLDIPMKSVKVLLLAILYGTPLTLSSGSAIVKTLGKEKGKEFIEHRTVAGIIRGVKDSVDELEESGVLDSIMKEYDIPATKALSYYIQNIEAMILNYCIQYYKPEALFYDGFITKEDVDVKMLERNILEDLEYDIKITKEKLGQNLSHLMTREPVADYHLEKFI